jgi:hypothetical protein
MAERSLSADGEAAIPAAFGSDQGWAARSFLPQRILYQMKGIADSGFIAATSGRRFRYFALLALYDVSAPNLSRTV